MSLLEAVQPDSGISEPEILSLQAELRRRFAGVGCMARAGDLALLFPGTQPESVEEALHRLCEDGAVEVDCLSDGTLVFHFPRR
jgi:hypothetical protein